MVIDLRDNTFYANIYLRRDDQEFVIDSRPSDAIALALRMKSPLFVDKKVIEKSKKIEMESQDKTADQKDKWAEILESLSPEDFGKYKM